MKYSQERKQAVLVKLAPPHQRTVKDVAARAKAPGAPRPPTTHRADQPNQVWCWDITWLPGPIRGQFYFLYLIIDLHNRADSRPSTVGGPATSTPPEQWYPPVEI